jgi:tyrosyl-tRNA synthetase
MLEKVLEDEPYNQQANLALKEAATAAGWPEIGIFALRTLLEQNPRDVKVRLAKSIITDFHSKDAANEAEDDFNKRFVKKEIPDEIEERQIGAGSYKLADLIVSTGMAASKGEARRLIEQGGVKVNGEKASNAATESAVGGSETLLQVGKRKFLKIRG